MRARLLLAVIVFPAFAFYAQRQTGAASSGVTTAAPAGNAWLDQVPVRSASIDGGWFDIVSAYVSGVRVLERLRSAVFLAVLDTEAGAADDVGLPAARFTPYRTHVDGTWPAHAESEGRVYAAKRAIEKSDALPVWELTGSRANGCWWVWVFTGTPVC